MKVKVLARWDECGQGPAVQELLNYLDVGQITKINGMKLTKIIELKNNTKLSEDVPNVECSFDPRKMYNVYYNYHSSSGFETQILNKTGKYEIAILRPKGGVMCAFWSEVIIFEDSNIVSFPLTP